jgi:pSer/pThr/pTyr-binding forkhead associated (FHA) protein
MVPGARSRARPFRARVMVHGRALLVALTPEARDALGAPERDMKNFPYRVGRESRGTQRTPQGMVSERRNPGSRPSNDLYLPEHDEPMNVSREHFEIDRSDTGYVLADRASTCGTIVEGQPIGGDTRGGTLSLHDGDVIIVGTSRSPYVFKFRVG